MENPKIVMVYLYFIKIIIIYLKLKFFIDMRKSMKRDVDKVTSIPTG